MDTKGQRQQMVIIRDETVTGITLFLTPWIMIFRFSLPFRLQFEKKNHDINSNWQICAVYGWRSWLPYFLMRFGQTYKKQFPFLTKEAEECWSMSYTWLIAPMCVSRGGVSFSRELMNWRRSNEVVPLNKLVNHTGNANAMPLTDVRKG